MYLAKWIFLSMLAGVLSYVSATYVGESEFSRTGFTIAVIIAIPVGYIVYRDKKKFREYNRKSS